MTTFGSDPFQRAPGALPAAGVDQPEYLDRTRSTDRASSGSAPGRASRDTVTISSQGAAVLRAQDAAARAAAGDAPPASIGRQGGGSADAVVSAQARINQGVYRRPDVFESMLNTLLGSGDL